MNKDHYVPVSNCPKCGRAHDGAVSASPTHRAAPIAGDLGVCVYCGTFNRYDAALQLVTLTPEQFGALPSGVRRRLNAARHMLLSRN